MMDTLRQGLQRYPAAVRCFGTLRSSSERRITIQNNGLQYDRRLYRDGAALSNRTVRSISGKPGTEQCNMQIYYATCYVTVSANCCKKVRRATPVTDQQPVQVYCKGI